MNLKGTAAHGRDFVIMLVSEAGLLKDLKFTGVCERYILNFKWSDVTSNNIFFPQRSSRSSTTSTQIFNERKQWRRTELSSCHRYPVQIKFRLHHHGPVS